MTAGPLLNEIEQSMMYNIYGIRTTEKLPMKARVAAVYEVDSNLATID